MRPCHSGTCSGKADQMRGKQILMTALIALGVVIAYDKQMNK